MEGRHPVDSSPLRRMTRASTVAAIDLTFSAPKSVSVLYAVAGGEMSAALSDAHERAVAVAVVYLEREACFTRCGHAGASGSRARDSSPRRTGIDSRGRATRSCTLMSSPPT
jgi:conjugative relaxase-like TrwC/TraI family protein